MNAVYYGVYNTMKKEFQFGICEPSKRKATKKLFKRLVTMHTKVVLK